VRRRQPDPIDDPCALGDRLGPVRNAAMLATPARPFFTLPGQFIPIVGVEPAMLHRRTPTSHKKPSRHSSPITHPRQRALRLTRRKAAPATTNSSKAIHSMQPPPCTSLMACHKKPAPTCHAERQRSI